MINTHDWTVTRMLRLDEELHARGETTPVEDWLTMQALGWWIAAELVRRHPGDLIPYLTGGDFQNDCLAVSRFEPVTPDGPQRLIVMMNRQPSGHLTHVSWFGDPANQERFNWLEVLLTTDRLTYVVEQLEREAGLPSPSQTPATTEASVGVRAISAFLNRTMLQRKSWVATCGVWEGGQGDAGFNDDLFDAVPGMNAVNPRLTQREFEIPRESCRFWFLRPTIRSNAPPEFQPEAGPPTIGLDVLSGQCWVGDNPEPVDLMKRYNTLGRSIDALVSAVFPPAF
jgi:hypothetical protein